MKTQQLEKVLQEEIPLTLAIGLKVEEISDKGVMLTAPLEPNINHKHTAFGGSLYNVCVLAGWSFLYAKLNTLGERAHIVIQESHIQYLKPVVSEIQAFCAAPDDNELQRFMKVYRKKGRSRITLQSIVNQGTVEAVIFTGKYVIHR